MNRTAFFDADYNRMYDTCMRSVSDVSAELAEHKKTVKWDGIDMDTLDVMKKVQSYLNQISHLLRQS